MSTLVGLDELARKIGAAGEAWQQMHHTHSSTVATNALIERRGAVLGMLVTEGFRDMFELQRLALPNPMRWDSRRPTPLVPRSMVREVRERVDANGKVLTPIGHDSVLEGAIGLREVGAEIILICFLHSYRNPVHEKEARELILRTLPDARVEISAEVWPQAREFERATLSAVNAYVRPIVEAYVAQLRDGLRARSLTVPARAARSNGGMELLESLTVRPAVALLSGPAAGVSGAATAAAEAGWPAANLMTLDIGGTSADIGVVREGRPVLSTEEHVADFPLLVPTVAVSSIGAGGGSIIWVDESGSLKVGPRSVGADPAPACYAQSNALIPALTDAFLVAGFLAEGQLLGDRISLQMAPARKALASVAESLGYSVEEVADGAIQIATAMMAAEATNVLAKRGVEIPEFRMVAFGGAGPMLAALLAEDVYLDTVLIPVTPGTLSALGAARADLEGDFVQPVYATLDGLSETDLRHAHQELTRRVKEWVGVEAGTLPVTAVAVQYSADMRYDGQGYDVTVPVEEHWLTDGRLADLGDAFHVAHRASYGHAQEHGLVWVRELRAHVIGGIPKPRTQQSRKNVPVSTPGRERWRNVVVRGQTYRALVLQRSEVPSDAPVIGPAVIEQMDTTTMVPPGWRLEPAQSGALVLQRGEG